MLFNKNKLLIAMKFLNKPCFFAQRNINFNYKNKNVEEWGLLLWNYLKKEIRNIDENIEKINRNDFNKFIIYFFNDIESANLFNFISQDKSYINLESIINFLLHIHFNDYYKIINTYQK